MQIANALPDRILALAVSVSERIVYVDLAPVLVDATRTDQVTYINDDSHWSAIGLQMAGVTLSRVLLEPEQDIIGR